MSVDEFIYHFKKMEVNFYCENLAEVKEQFENILEENDWFESEVLCFDPHFLVYRRKTTIISKS
jgi:hypothetical protein